MTDNGRVLFDIYPEGSEIYLNGTFVGVAPLDLIHPTGAYTATVKKKGYHTLSFSIEIAKIFPPNEYIYGLERK